MKSKVITIEVTDKEVDALEDILFCKLSEEQWNSLIDAKNSLWEKIATAFDSEDPKRNAKERFHRKYGGTVRGKKLET